MTFMSTDTTTPAPPSYLEDYARTVTRFVRRIDRWRDAVANGTEANLTPPSKNVKNRAYEVAFHINQYLGRDRARTVEDLRETVAAYRAVAGSSPSPTSKAAGVAWAARARAAGFTVRTSDGYDGDVVTLHRTFTPGDSRAYIVAESEALSLMSGVPVVGPTTTWGTTSDGVGGHAGMTRGYVEILRSGVSKRFASGVR
jgi:hypothetical protein